VRADEYKALVNGGGRIAPNRPKDLAAVKRLAKKGERLLERYRKLKVS
jgi:hypothetical protein